MEACDFYCIGKMGAMLNAAPDIAAALKINSRMMEKEQISGILFFDGEWSYLRSRHLVLWSLGTLTG